METPKKSPIRGSQKVMEWYRDLPEPYRTQAFRNTPAYLLDSVADSLTSALLTFPWESTLKIGQGYEYWHNVFNKVTGGTL